MKPIKVKMLRFNNRVTFPGKTGTTAVTTTAVNGKEPPITAEYWPVANQFVLKCRDRKGGYETKRFFSHAIAEWQSEGDIAYSDLVRLPSPPKTKTKK